MKTTLSNAIDDIIDHLSEVDSKYLAEQFKAITANTIENSEDPLDDIREVLWQWDEDAITTIYKELMLKDIVIVE